MFFPGPAGRSRWSASPAMIAWLPRPLTAQGPRPAKLVDRSLPGTAGGARGPPWMSDLAAPGFWAGARRVKHLPRITSMNLFRIFQVRRFEPPAAKSRRTQIGRGKSSQRDPRNLRPLCVRPDYDHYVSHFRFILASNFKASSYKLQCAGRTHRPGGESGQWSPAAAHSGRAHASH